MTKTQKTLALVLVLLVAGACGKKVPVLVAETGLKVVRTINAAQRTNRALVDNGTYSPQVGLDVQDKLTKANDALKPLPALLRAIHVAQQTNEDVNANDVESALRVVESASSALDLSVKGVPVADATKQVRSLVVEALKTLTAIRAELAKLRPAQPAPAGV